MAMRFSVFKDFPEVLAAFSVRANGDMRVRGAAASTEANRQRYLASLSVPSERAISIEAVHAADVIRVGRREAGAVMRHVDGLFTDERDVFLSVTAADCLALYLYDPKTKEAALLHAGWRGLARGIISKAFRQFQDPSRIRAAISPFVQVCHFEVGDDVASLFTAHPEALIQRGEKTFIDLGAVAFKQLLESGANSEYIEVSEECTACDLEQYFSYRRDKPELRVMMAVLGVRENTI